MWTYHALEALDLARERQREADRHRRAADLGRQRQQPRAGLVVRVATLMVAGLRARGLPHRRSLGRADGRSGRPRPAH